LSVITLSQAFQGFWNDLALDLDTAIDLIGPAEAVTSSPETAAVIVAAGGAERDATQWLETHRVRPDLPALVVGGRRRAGARLRMSARLRRPARLKRSARHSRPGVRARPAKNWVVTLRD